MEIKLDQEQLNQISKGRESAKSDRIDAIIRILPVLAAITAALWTLILYFDTERQRYELENRRLEQQIQSGDIERAKLENEVAIQSAQIRLDSLSRRERNVSLTAKKISNTLGETVYAVDYTAVVKNTAKVTTVIDYNMVSIYRGVFAGNVNDFAVAVPPTWLDASPKKAGAIQWHRLHCFFNKRDVSTVDIAKIKQKYAPNVIDRTGTGDIVPGDSMKLGYSFYVKAKPDDWLAVVYHGSFDKGNNDDDSKTFIEWNQLRQLESITQQDNAPSSAPAARL